MGQNPTDSEVHHMINQVDVDGSGAVEFDEFCHFMVKLMKNHDQENEVKEAYRSFSYGLKPEMGQVRPWR